VGCELKETGSDRESNGMKLDCVCGVSLCVGLATDLRRKRATISRILERVNNDDCTSKRHFVSMIRGKKTTRTIIAF
jgi:hypothetical protein